MQRLIDRCRPLYTQPTFRRLFYLNVLLGFAYSFVLPFMSMFGTIEAGMSKARFGIFMTITTAAGILIGTVVAKYSDTHFSRRAILLWGSVSGVAGYVGYAYCRSFLPLLVIGTVVLGLSTCTFSQLFAYARELLEASDVAPSQRVFYMNAFRMFFALSWTVGPMAAAWIMLHYSYKGLFLSAAANFVLFAIVVYQTVPAAPPLFAKQAAQAPQSMLQLLSRVDLSAHLAAMGLICAATTMNMVNLPLLILETLHGNQVNVGITYTVAPIFEIPFMLYFGWLATHKASVDIVRVGLVIAVAYFLSLLLVAQPWQVYFCQILSAALTAVISGVAITYFQSHLPHHPGTATNLYSNAMKIGSTAGYFMFGAIAERYGYRSVFAACAGFSVLALALMFVPVRLPEVRPSVVAGN